MQVRINTDDNIDGLEKFTGHVKDVVDSVLSRFGDRITRVELHLRDENGDKSGQDDKRCVMEARHEGWQPTAVTHHGATLEQAVIY